jgi:hypothetical protein
MNKVIFVVKKVMPRKVLTFWLALLFLTIIISSTIPWIFEKGYEISYHSIIRDFLYLFGGAVIFFVISLIWTNNPLHHYNAITKSRSVITITGITLFR